MLLRKQLTTKLALIAILAFSLIENHKIEASEEGKKVKRKVLSFLDYSPYARDRVIELIVNEYTSKPVNETASDWLDSAIEAIELSESDGEPVQIQDHDFLFVGSVGEPYQHKLDKEICSTS